MAFRYTKANSSIRTHITWRSVSNLKQVDMSKEQKESEDCFPIRVWPVFKPFSDFDLEYTQKVYSPLPVYYNDKCRSGAGRKADAWRGHICVTVRGAGEMSTVRKWASLVKVCIDVYTHISSLIKHFDIWILRNHACITSYGTWHWNSEIAPSNNDYLSVVQMRVENF